VKETFMQRIKDTSSGSYLSTLGGDFGVGPDGKQNGTMASSRLEGDTAVNHILHIFQSQEIETTERFRVDHDSREIVITRDVTSSGKRLQYEMRFPYSPPHDPTE
jgi:hypothetical protein